MAFTQQNETVHLFQRGAYLQFLFFTERETEVPRREKQLGFTPRLIEQLSIAWGVHYIYALPRPRPSSDPRDKPDGWEISSVGYGRERMTWTRREMIQDWEEASVRAALLCVQPRVRECE